MVSRQLLTRRLLKCLDGHGIAVEGMYLFGSTARGEATHESDIDVLLVSSSFGHKGIWTRCALVGEAVGELDDPVQMYPVTPQEFDHPEPGGFLESIREQLKVLYKRAG